MKPNFLQGVGCRTKVCGKAVGGGRVTRFPFGPLYIFVYISHWAARVNSQNRRHFEGGFRNWWLTRALLDAIQLAVSRSNMITYLCKIGTWYYYIWYRFYTWSLQPEDFCMVVTGTLRQSVGFPGARKAVQCTTVALEHLKFWVTIKCTRFDFFQRVETQRKFFQIAITQ